MKIKKLEIVGFKSFVDRTVLHFDHDVTGIVGPNGCGKSNVVDAIRWCMGEQSARHLRGKSMEDVIFNGSENRGPHSFAEVTITFDNSAGLGPAEYRDYAELAVTRRLDRLGNSDYYINKTAVRLLDVVDLFLGTGVGTKAYSIIEQGRVGFIVSSKPEERRYLIEEAAGVTKFKAKKKAAERKMEQTRDNLVRIGDITAEIERSLASLKRQAQKAERYKEYRGEMRDLELYTASHKYLELFTVGRVAKAELEAESAAAEGARFALRLRDAEVETERLALYEVERTLDDAQTNAFALDNSVKALESEIARHHDRISSISTREEAATRELSEIAAQHDALLEERRVIAESLVSLEEISAREAEELLQQANELETRRVSAREAEQLVGSARGKLSESQQRIARAEAVLTGFERRRNEAGVRLTRMQQERDELEKKHQMLAEELEVSRARLDGLRNGKVESAERKAELEAELLTLRTQIQESDKAIEKVRAELSQKRSRLHSLEELRKRFDGVEGGARTVMAKFGNAQNSGVFGLLADRFEVPSDLTQALAGALGDRLQDIIVNDIDRASELAVFLAEGEKGRAAFMPRSPRRVVKAQENLSGTEGVVGWMSDLVTCAPEDEALVRHVLSDVLVVEDMHVAKRLHGELRATIVTKRGEMLSSDGRLTGGRGEDVGAHMLDVKREIRELHGVVAKLDVQMNEALAHHNELRTGIASRQAAIDAARTEAHDRELSLVRAERDIHQAESDLARAADRMVKLAKEIGEMEHALHLAGEEEDSARNEILSATTLLNESKELLVTAEETHRERRSAVEEQNTVVTEVRVRAAQAKQRAEGDRNTVARLLRSIEELQSRADRLRTEVDSGKATQSELQLRLSGESETLQIRITEAMAAHSTLNEVKIRFDAARAALAEHDNATREVRAKIEKMDKRINELTIRCRELQMDLEHLMEHVLERHRLVLPKIIGDYHARELPSPQVKVRIDELARLIERMGEINLTAIEEYEEQSKRFDYYSMQKKDLEDALSQLDKAIRKMNMESRKLFRETFAEVNARFKRVFPTMFGGGQAELRLTNPEDLLESGVEIVAQPPGKKLGSIELMSGGEKALTAVSLIFAIFSYKPSPFCILDEVDAPLDEANIGRFADAIRQMTENSQFILITHSKRTMETADMLYGVTMEMPGVSKLVAVELRKAEAKKKPAPIENVAVA